MKLLELFSGTGSVGKVAKTLGWEVVSLDLKNADINEDILKWDYEKYEPNYFDFVWASPLVRNIVWQKEQPPETSPKQMRL